MLNPDDPKIIKRYDKSGMLELIESFPEQCEEARTIGLNFKIDRSFKCRYENVVCAGVGGSAIGADIARSYLLDSCPCPITVNRNYRLPGFVGNRTLVIASSYSGNTEETLFAYKDARSRKAKIIAITSGGELQRLASRDGIPAIAVPKSFPPRAALGYSFFPLLILLSKIGLAQDSSKEVDDAIEILRDVRREKNRARLIAKSLYLKYPIIYSGQDHMDAVSVRWKGQFAENSKTLSSCNVLPEMTHNEIVGWENPKRALKDFTVIMLRDRQDHPRVAKRMEITKKIIRNAGIGIIEVDSLGEGLLSRVCSLIYIGDFVSFYLAMLNRRDPTPVERIEYLKRELAKG